MDIGYSFDSTGTTMNELQCKLHFTQIILTAFLMIGAMSTAVQAEEIIRIGGAGTGLGVMKVLAATFEKSHQGKIVKVLPNLGSSGGIKALLHGAIDLAISGRSLKAEESNEGAMAVKCAITPFIFVTNKNVNKADLTSLELEMIYNGQLQKWADGTRIRPILRPWGDTDTAIVKAVSKEMEQALKSANGRPDMIMMVTDQEAAEAVAKIPGALGSSTLAQIETERHPLNVLSFNGIKATPAALANGNYPLSKPLYLVSTSKTPAAARQFIRFVQSAKGRAILTKSGFLPTNGNTVTK
jgi:phosphate transport system substrate-binding protein